MPLIRKIYNVEDIKIKKKDYQHLMQAKRLINEETAKNSNTQDSIVKYEHLDNVRSLKQDLKQLKHKIYEERE